MRVAGADVWKGRWVVVLLDDSRFDRAFVAPSIQIALEPLVDAVAIGIDIPIGLPEVGARRAADVEARAFVGPRAHSVFLTPSRDLLEAPSLGAANELARSTGRPGVSAQTYGLGRLVLEVAPVAERDRRLFEVHPEASFVTANEGRHLAWAKTTWNGVNLRREILRRQGIAVPDDLGAAGAAGIPDVLDAAAVAWSATRIASGRAECLPSGHGRVGAIWR